MKETQPSITAENNAAVRASEWLRPARMRICHDRFARFFLPEDIYRTADSARRLGGLISRWNKSVPGVCDAILVRTRFIDERLQAAIDRGLRQLVVLGAGYDSRALRFDQLKRGGMIFELDHPATQKIKRRRIEENHLPLSDHLIFIPCRFDTEDFASKLLTSGYDAALPTFFVWEGMTYYLTRRQVDRILSFIARRSPTGSELVFDYLPPSVVDGTNRLTEARVLRQALQQMPKKRSSAIC